MNKLSDRLKELDWSAFGDGCYFGNKAGTDGKDLTQDMLIAAVEELESRILSHHYMKVQVKNERNIWKKACELMHHDLGVEQWARKVKTSLLSDYLDLAKQLLENENETK